MITKVKGLQIKRRNCSNSHH